MPQFATVLETNGCATPSVNLQHYSLNRPFEWVPTQNANNVEDSPTGRRMGVNRDFTAWEFLDWLHFPPAVFAKTRRPRSSYGRAYGRRVSAAAAIGKRSCHGHWVPDSSPTGQNSRDTPPLYLVPLGTMSCPCSRCTCYDMATYPCIYVYDAPGINPSSLWQLWSWNFIFLSWD